MRYVLGYEGYIEYEAEDGTRLRFQKSRPSEYHISTYNTGVWPNQIPATGTVSRTYNVAEYPSDEMVDAVHALLLAGHADHLAAAERLEWPLTEEERTPPARPRPVRFDHALCCWVDETGARACQDA